MKLRETVLGELYSFELGARRFHFFCGTRTSGLEELQVSYPQYRFCGVQQFHSAECVPASAELPRADAHWTAQAGCALYIQTADCLPVLIADIESGGVLAIHAGWRGLSQQIISKALRMSGFASSTCKVWIGPHIRRENFEVGSGVAQTLQAQAEQIQCRAQVVWPHADPSKRYVDLTKLAEQELRSHGVVSVFTHAANTFTDTRYPSFRRDGTGGRMFCWVVCEA